MAVAGFVLAVCGAVFSWVPFLNFILQLLGVIFSGVGLSRAKKLPDRKGRGLAIAGLIISIGFILLSILIVAGLMAATFMV